MMSRSRTTDPPGPSVYTCEHTCTSTHGWLACRHVSHQVPREATFCCVQAAEQREQRSPGSQRGLLRSYVALAVLRQAALSLRHYGVRCAHLYLRHSMVLQHAILVLACSGCRL